MARRIGFVSIGLFFLLVCAACAEAVRAEWTCGGSVRQIFHGGKGLFSGPAECRIVEARDGVDVPGRLEGVSRGTREAEFSFSSGRAALNWGHLYRVDGALAWNIELRNHAETRRAVHVVMSFRLPGENWRSLFCGMNDSPDWPDEGTLRYVYIRSQETSDNNLPHWNAVSPLTIPFGSFFNTDDDLGVSFVAQDLDDPFYTASFDARRHDGHIDISVTFPRVRLEPNGSRDVTLYVVPHAGDWRPGLGWMRGRWPGAFDVPGPLWRMQSPGYEGESATGDDVQGEVFTDEYWTRRLRPHPWKDRLMIQSRGFDRWYGMWAPEKEPWHANIGHKYRQLIAHPEQFPPEIVQGMPTADAPWREQLAYIENLDYMPPPGVRTFLSNKSSLYPMWETFTHADVHRFTDKVHRRGWHTISHFDIFEAWAPWLAQEFPDSAFPGHWFYDEPIWKLTDPFPGSPFREHIVGQLRRLFELWPGYDGIMMDQLYYERERDAADDGITVSNDGTPASNLHRNNGRVMAELHGITRSLGKTLWGNHARTSIAITRYTDLLISEGTSLPGMDDDPGKWMTIGTRGGHGIGPSELANQMCMLRGWTASALILSGRTVHAAKRDEHEFHVFPYYAMMDLLPGRRWELTAHALELPNGLRGNIFRRADGNILMTVVTFGSRMHSPWWRGNLPVTMRLEDAEDFKAAYLLAADHLGPKKICFDRADDRINLAIPLHRSVSTILLAKKGRFIALDGKNLIVSNGRSQAVRLHLDNWSSEVWDFQGHLVRRPRIDADETHPATEWTELSASAAPASSGAVEFELTPSAENTIHGFTRFTIAHDTQVLLPKPDALPGNQSTFEMILSGSMFLSVAPSQDLAERRISNSQEFKRAWKPIQWARPLSIREGEAANFLVTIGNPTDEEIPLSVLASGQGLAADGLPERLVVPPREFVTRPIRVRGLSPGKRTFRLTAIAGGGAETKTSLDLRVVGTSLQPADLSRVQSVRLIFDSWYSPGAVGAPIRFNGEAAGELPGNGGYATWTVRQPHALAENVAGALQSENRVEIDASGHNFKMKNVLLELTLDDGRVVELASSETRPQSVSPDWPAAEGVRLEAGRPMAWNFPLR